MSGSALASLGEWNWIALGILLLCVEIVAPGTFLLWIGFAAIATGAVFLLVPASIQVQLAVFAVLAIASIMVWMRFARRERAEDGPANPHLNRRGDALIGRTFVLDAPITNGRGTIRVDDSIWPVSGPDLAAGSRVTTRAIDGNTLVVEPSAD